MRILFASLAFPFPANSGQRVRNSSLLMVLAREGHRVTLVSFLDKQDEAHLAKAERWCDRVIAVPLPRAPKLRDAGVRLQAAVSRIPFGVKRFQQPEMQAQLERELQGNSYDAVICDDVYMFNNLPAGARPPVLLNKHDLTYEIMERYAGFERNPLKRAYIRFEAGNVRRWEERVCGQADAVLACSARDLRLIAEFCPGRDLYVVPNAIDVEQYRPASCDDGKTLLYVGAMDWYPNRDAVQYFLTGIFPILRRLLPGLRLVVAGRGTSREFAKFATAWQAPDVAFAGEVPDMAAQIAAATVCIVPLRIGSGTRLKILESAAMAKAVVSTGVGAEGLEFRHQQEIMIADSAHEFAGQVIAILKDAGLRARLGRAARDRVEHCYSFEVLRRSLSAALAECAGKPSAHAATALIGGEMPLSPAKPSQAGAERSCQALSRQEAARN